MGCTTQVNLKLQTLVNNNVLILVQESSSSPGRTSHNYLNIFHGFWQRIKIRYMIKYCWQRLVLFIFTIDKQLRPSFAHVRAKSSLAQFVSTWFAYQKYSLSPCLINILYPPSFSSHETETMYNIVFKWQVLLSPSDSLYISFIFIKLIP